MSYLRVGAPSRAEECLGAASLRKLVAAAREVARRREVRVDRPHEWAVETCSQQTQNGRLRTGSGARESALTFGALARAQFVSLASNVGGVPKATLRDGYRRRVWAVSRGFWRLFRIYSLRAWPLAS